MSRFIALITILTDDMAATLSGHRRPSFYRAVDNNGDERCDRSNIPVQPNVRTAVERTPLR